MAGLLNFSKIELSLRVFLRICLLFQDPGDVTSIVSCRGRVMSYDDEEHDVVFAGSDDGFVAMYDGALVFEKDWKAQVSLTNT